MEAWFLREWQRNSGWQLLLRPVSWVFAAVVVVRRALYRAGILSTKRLPVATIVVGNISVGGTGKTPLVLAIVETLERSGRRCGIITRGYAKSDQVPGATPVMEVGRPQEGKAVTSDEAALLAGRSGVPVFAGQDRVQVGLTLLRKHPDVDTIVCDDGLQHCALARDIEIAVIDGTRGHGNGALLPAGPLREPVSRLSAVGAIVIHDAAGAGAEAAQLALPGNVPEFRMRLGNEAAVRLLDGQTQSMGDARVCFSGRRIAAVAGTGHPGRFFDHLKHLGFLLAGSYAYPDHHPFKAEDFAGIEADIVLMTEKDAVKCMQFADERMWFMRVDALVPEALGAFLLERLSTLGK